MFKWLCDLGKITLSSDAVYPCCNEGKRVLNCVVSHMISDLSGCCMEEHRQASGQACSCFCRYGCEGRIKHRNEFVSCWILAPLFATGVPASPGSHVTCVCVCVCVCFFQMSAWSVLLKNNVPASCTSYVISATDIGSVHGVPAWSGDMWWTLVAKLM